MPCVARNTFSKALPLVFVLMTGCAVVNPYVSSPPIPEKPVDYDKVLKLALATKAEIIEDRKSLQQFKFWSGAVLIGTGVAGAALGTMGGTQDAILGTAIGAGGVVAGRTYVPVEDRQRIYNQGIHAIDCAMNATDTDVKSMVTLKNFSPFPTAADLNIIDFDAAGNPKGALTPIQVLAFSEEMSAETKFVEADRAIQTAQQEVASFDRADALYMALTKIVLTINQQLTSEILDPNAAIAAATNHIGAKITKINTQIHKAEEAIERGEERVMAGQKVLNVGGFPADKRFSIYSQPVDDRKRKIQELKNIAERLSECMQGSGGH